MEKQIDMEKEQNSQRTDNSNNAEWLIEAITWTLVMSLFVFA